MGKHIANVARLFISLTAIGVLIWLFKDRLHGVGQYLKSANLGWFALAFIGYCLALYTLSYRFYLFSKVQKVALTVGDCFYLNVIAHFFNNFFPSSMGGDVVKIYYAYKKTHKKVGSFVSVIIDRFCGLLTFILFAIGAILFYGRQVGNRFIYIVLLVAVVLSAITILFFWNKNVAQRFKFLLVLIPRKIRHTLDELYHAFHGFRHDQEILLAALLFSLGGQILVVAANFWIAKSLGLPVHFFVFVLMIPLISFVSLLAPSLNGLGIREGAYVYFFSRFVAGEGALALSILWYGLLLIMSFLGGVWYALQGQLRVSEIQEAVKTKQIEKLLNV